jgi:TetR/AcrR family transcriptional regulator, transcriptional repressor for nem operon
MAQPDSARRPARLTARGAATRARILDAAADLMFARGVAATTLDDVRIASDTSKSQLYHHFADKDALVDAVIELQGARVLEREQRRLARLDSLRALDRWRDAIVQNNELRSGAYGCAIGSLANELADRDEDARTALAQLLASWRSLLGAGLERMRAAGALRADADPDALATGLMAALQGGYLLAQAEHDSAPLATALDMAIAHVKSFATTA